MNEPTTATQPLVNEAGLELIKSFEGCRYKAYRCPAGIWTCGYGATGPDVTETTEWTPEQATARLKRDVDRFATGLARMLKGNTTQNEFSAMVCLAYNIGLGAFAKSSILRNHVVGDKKAAAQAFLLYTKAAGRQLPGLVRRREAEKALYQSP